MHFPTATLYSWPVGHAIFDFTVGVATDFPIGIGRVCKGTIGMLSLVGGTAETCCTECDGAACGPVGSLNVACAT